MTRCNPEIKRGYYWGFISGEWYLLRYNGKWYKTDEISNLSICELVEDCVVLPIAEPVFIEAKVK